MERSCLLKPWNAMTMFLRKNCISSIHCCENKLFPEIRSSILPERSTMWKDATQFFYEVQVHFHFFWMTVVFWSFWESNGSNEWHFLSCNTWHATNDLSWRNRVLARNHCLQRKDLTAVRCCLFCSGGSLIWKGILHTYYHDLDLSKNITYTHGFFFP